MRRFFRFEEPGINYRIELLRRITSFHTLAYMEIVKADSGKSKELLSGNWLLFIVTLSLFSIYPYKKYLKEYYEYN
jgi:hypothetical protein